MFGTYKEGILSEDGIKGIAKLAQASQLDADVVANMSA